MTGRMKFPDKRVSLERSFILELHWVFKGTKAELPIAETNPRKQGAAKLLAPGLFNDRS